MIDGQKSDDPLSPNRMEGLYRSGDNSLTERGGYEGHVMESSLYTKASLRPLTTGTMFAVGLGAAYFLGRSLLSRTESPAADVSEPAEAAEQPVKQGSTANAGAKRRSTGTDGKPESI